MAFKELTVQVDDVSGGMAVRRDGRLTPNQVAWAHNVVLTDGGGFHPIWDRELLFDLGNDVRLGSVGAYFYSHTTPGGIVKRDNVQIDVDCVVPDVNDAMLPIEYIDDTETPNLILPQFGGAWNLFDLPGGFNTTLGLWSLSPEETYGTGADTDYVPANSQPVVWHNRLWVLETDQQTVRYSHPERFLTWKSDDYLKIPPGEVGEAIWAYGDFLMIFCRTSVYVVTGWDSNDFTMTQGLAGLKWYIANVQFVSFLPLAANVRGKCYFARMTRNSFELWSFDGKGFKLHSERVGDWSQWLGFEDADSNFYFEAPQVVALQTDSRRVFIQMYGASITDDTVQPVVRTPDGQVVRCFVYDPGLDAWTTLSFDGTSGEVPNLLFAPRQGDASILWQTDNNEVYGFKMDATSPTRTFLVRTQWLRHFSVPYRRRWGRGKIVVQADTNPDGSYTDLTVNVYHNYDAINVARTFSIVKDSEILNMPPGGLAYSAAYELTGLGSYSGTGGDDFGHFNQMSIQVKERQ